jgi:hypothetical protein
MKYEKNKLIIDETNIKFELKDKIVNFSIKKKTIIKKKGK